MKRRERERERERKKEREREREREGPHRRWISRIFGDEIRQRPTQQEEQENRKKSPLDNETNRDAESTISNNSERSRGNSRI